MVVAGIVGRRKKAKFQVAIPPHLCFKFEQERRENKDKAIEIKKSGMAKYIYMI